MRVIVNKYLDPLYDGCFTEWKWDNEGNWLINEYVCSYCKDIWMFTLWGWGEPEVVDVDHGFTDDSGSWSRGIPTTRRECTNCKRWDDPWVSSAYGDPDY